jgi:hypothetical protein
MGLGIEFWPTVCLKTPLSKAPLKNVIRQCLCALFEWDRLIIQCEQCIDMLAEKWVACHLDKSTPPAVAVWLTHWHFNPIKN